MGRLKEIETRLTAIAEELTHDDADLDALETEMNNLVTERTKITDAINKRQSLLTNVRNMGVPSIEITGDQDRQERFGIDSKEYRAAWLKNVMGKELNAEERTAVTATATIPTQTMNMIVGKMELTPLIAAVDVTYIPGNVSYPAEDSVADASWVAMGTASTDGADTLTSITLSAYKLIKTIEISADVTAMSIDAFESWLVERLSNKLFKAVDVSILKGTGTNQATGLNSLTAKGTFTKTGMTYKDILGIIAALPSEYAPNASFVMDRTLFYSEVLGITTTTGDKVVVADLQSPAKFNILGYPVIIDDNSPTDTLFFGELKAYKFNFSKSPTVEPDKSVGFRTGSTCYRVMALADGKISDNKAVNKYTRAAA